MALGPSVIYSIFGLALAGQPMHIVITTTYNEFLNVREVQAKDGATLHTATSASMSSTWAGLPASNAIDGDLGDDVAHNGQLGADEWLRITYPAGTNIGSIIVYNHRVVLSQHNAARIEGMKIEVQEGATTVWESTFVGVHDEYTFQVVTTTTSTTTTSISTTTSMTETRTLSSTTSSSSSLTSSASSTSTSSRTSTSTSSTLSTSLSSSSTLSSSSSSSSTLSSSSSSSSTSSSSSSLSTLTSSASTSTMRTSSTSTSSTSSSSSRSSSSSSSTAATVTTSMTLTSSSMSSSSTSSSSTSTSLRTSVSRSSTPSSTSSSSSTSLSSSSSSTRSSSSTWSSSSSSSSWSSSSTISSTSLSSSSSSASSWTSATTTTTRPTTVTTIEDDGLSTSATPVTATGTRTITARTPTRTASTTRIPMRSTGLTETGLTETSTASSSERPWSHSTSTSTTHVQTEPAAAEAAKEAGKAGVAKLKEQGSTTTTPGASVSNSTEPAASVAAEAAKEAGRAGVAKLKEQGLTKIEVESDVGKVIIFDLSAALANSSSAKIEGEEGSAVVVSQELLEALPGGAMISMVSITTEEGAESTFANVETESGTEVDASTILDISVYDANGQYVPTVLKKPLLFRLPGSKGLPPGSVQCKYLDTTGASPRWSSKGVGQATVSEVLASGQEATGVWCWTLHLSVFAAIRDVVLGCTNLELLSGEAVSAIIHHDGWETAVSATAVFLIAGVLLALFIIGQVREQWALRLGSTKSASKRLQCCNCLQIGPQILKHKYTAFIVYARDVIDCLRAGHASHHKLKSSSLTSALQRFLSIESGISTACVSQHLWNGNGWVDSKASIPITVLCAKLEFHSFVVDDLIKRLCGKGVWPCIRRFALTLLAIHPLLDAIRVGGGSMTCGKRMLLQLCGVFGVLASNALIFSFSGSARSWEADAKCPIPHASHFFFVVASSISILVNALPNKWLTDLAKQVHGQPMWNLVFWMAAISHLAAGGLLVLIALANLNPKDQVKWYTALEWAMLIKMVGMPTAQGLRHWLMLESFLHEDGQVEANKQFRVTMGLKHPNERDLTERECEMVENWASQAISCFELVRFTSLLGEVMPEFDLEQSSSGALMHSALVPGCFRQLGRLQDISWSVEALSISGLCQDLVAWNQPLRVRVMCLAKQLGSERLCREEHISEEVKALSRGRTCLCRCSFQATLGGLRRDEAIGFEVLQGKRSLGLACLLMEEVCWAKGWSGKLVLHSPEAEDQEDNTGADAEGSAFQVPPQAAQVPAPSVTGSQGVEGPRHLARIDVRILPPSFVEMARSLDETEPETEPADVMVVHSKQGKFVNLVSAVVTDALGDSHDYYEVVEKKLHAGDFEGLQELLIKAGCEEKRYWIDMFAMDPAGLEEEGPWHEKLLACLPATIRSLRRIACEHKVAAIRKGHEALATPVTQLVVMDRHFHLMHEDCALSEIILARAMHMKQRLVLHHSHLQGDALGGELRKLATGLQDVSSMGGRPWAAAFLEDPQAVFVMVRDMVVEKVMELRSDSETAWEELAMTDIVATLGAVQGASVAERRSGRGGDGSLEDVDGDVGGD